MLPDWLLVFVYLVLPIFCTIGGHHQGRRRLMSWQLVLFQCRSLLSTTILNILEIRRKVKKIEMFSSSEPAWNDVWVTIFSLIFGKNNTSWVKRKGFWSLFVSFAKKKRTKNRLNFIGKQWKNRKERRNHG